MANILIVTEKPSVASNIANAIKVRSNERHEGYIEGYSEYFGCIVWLTWCFGHLVELAEPEAYDERYAKWRYEDLPILPEKFRYEIISDKKKQFAVIKKLMNSVGESKDDKKEISTLSADKRFSLPEPEIQNCCDAGREGELIFRLVYELSKCKKPVKRLWISSMEDEAIRDGFALLKPESEYDSLYEAALCRERADWIVGMNATRLFSCLYGQTLNVGRVMTPTLGMIVMRDDEIRSFKPTPFYTVQISLSGVNAASRRFEKREGAEELLSRCKADANVIVKSVDRKEKTEHPPLLYDLTSLQRDANRILGYTAQQTLDYTQSLYEKKLVTYPRTDSKYLTDDMLPMIPDLVSNVASNFGLSKVSIAQPERTVDSKKVSDHTALIPTATLMKTDLKNVPANEMAILKLIAVRLICAVGEDHKYAETTAVLTCGGEDFTLKSKEILKDGWKGIWDKFYPSKDKETDDGDVIKVAMPPAGSVITPDDMCVKEGKTAPPRRFTEDSILSAMENAGADEMPEDAERKGLGTPATRAGIIEKLVQKGFIERKGDKKANYLTATDKGTALITVMPEQIKSPSMTAEWEQKLVNIGKGEYSGEKFMEEISQMITSLVSDYEKVMGADSLMSGEKVIGSCPHCGSEVLEKQKGWFCSNRECRFALWKDNAYLKKIGKHLNDNIVDQLLRDGRVHLKGCKSQKTGKSYDADLVMMIGDDGRPSFSLEFASNNPKHSKKKKVER